MIRLPSFQILRPKNVHHAVELMAVHGEDAALVAGGTDLLPKIKRRQLTPHYLISLNGLDELRGTRRNSGLNIGAGTTLTALANDSEVCSHYAALAMAAGLVSSPPLRNMGTLGGNLCLDTRCNYYDQSYFWREGIGFCLKKDGNTCHVAPGGHRCWAVSSGDCAPAVIALDGQFRLSGPNGTRQIRAVDLYRNNGKDHLAKTPQEILTDVILPPPNGRQSIYLKLRRRGSIDFPLLSVACSIRFGPDRRIEDAKIVLGAIASRCIEAYEAEKVLVGQRLEPDVIATAAKAAFLPARPMENTDGSSSWRKRVLPVYVRRALLELGTREQPLEPAGV